MKHIISIALVVITVSTLPAAPCRPDLSGEIFYQVLVRSFHDSDGDGTGDLKGLTQKLGHLSDLGVTAIWLNPLYASGLYHNYFADDFYAIDPELGTIEDFRALCVQAHARGIKVLLDMETQYITTQHAWYRAAMNDMNSDEAELIAWENRAEKIPLPGFADFREVRGYNGYTTGIMTLNMKSSALLAYQKKLFAFWLDPNADSDFRDGVDGFRMDHLMDDLDGRGIFTGLLAGFWRPIVRHVRAIRPDALFIVEPANWGADWHETLGATEMNAAFNIPLAQGIRALAPHPILEKLARPTKGIHALTIIENHDMDRFASSVDNDPRAIVLGAALMVSVPGVPCLYYGQELGATGERLDGMDDGNDIPVREAFRWSRNWKQKGMAVWYQGNGDWWKYASVRRNDGRTLEEQKDASGSIYRQYRTLLGVRRNSPALQRGGTRVLNVADDEVLAMIREHEGEAVLSVFNFAPRAKSLVLSEPARSTAPTLLFGGAYRNAENKHAFDLAPYGCAIMRLN